MLSKAFWLCSKQKRKKKNREDHKKETFNNRKKRKEQTLTGAVRSGRENGNDC